MNAPPKTTPEFEQIIKESGKEKFVLSLYITGTTPRSRNAVANIRKLCDEHLKNRHELEVVDIYQQPSLARGEQIVAAPTLIKKLPLTMRKVVGDMSDTDRVLVSLGLEPSRNPGR